jgi:hypothetical protein
MSRLLLILILVAQWGGIGFEFTMGAKTVEVIAIAAVFFYPIFSNRHTDLTTIYPELAKGFNLSATTYVEYLDDLDGYPSKLKGPN